jgi:hypothetical protein
LKSRLVTMVLVLGLVAFAVSGAYAASAHLGLAKGHHHGKKHAKKKHHAKKHHAAKKHQAAHQNAGTQPATQNEDSGNGENEGSGNGHNAAQHQYGTRPGKGCGDKNHVHTGPPGNPSNRSCPPQSQHH